ncbi:MAG TPA: trypsin-like peptidase domain-containing protein [Candidatus Saccharimonadales bacterium]|nr:trypsin-like peptidase domain-containing protein [Candidatus Saccharimonadales bacterium]
METEVHDENTKHEAPDTHMPASYETGSLRANEGRHHGAMHGSMRRVKFLGVAFLLIVAISSGFLGGWLGAKSRDDNSTSTNIQKQQVVLKSQGQLISSIAQNVGQSVVSVNVTGTAAAQNGLGALFGGGQSSVQQSAGTGIVISASGLIMTNRHVVPAGTTSVSVTLSDGTQYNNVQLIGRTSQNDSLDIAFLKIQDTKGKKLVPATIGDSSKVQVGDTVVAIGNALGQFQNTVTTGIISGHGRSIQASDSTGSSSENLEDLFQTDAAINEGNSGGPLVNLNGEVIGMNTATAGDGAQNIGFAIPINDVSGLIKGVQNTGKLQQPYLGVAYITLTDDIAQQLNLKVNRGAYVAPPQVSGNQQPVVAGSPAEKAGLKVGDIITAVNGKAIDQNNSLTSLLDQHTPGDSVTLTVNRNGSTVTLNATLGVFPAGD